MREGSQKKREVKLTVRVLEVLLQWWGSFDNVSARGAASADEGAPMDQKPSDNWSGSRSHITYLR
jgi:hypothetical protein